MIKTIKTMSKQEKERYTVPRKVQDVIPVRRIWPDGIFLDWRTSFSKTYRFSATSTTWWPAGRIRNPCSSPTRSCSIPWIPAR